MTSILRRFLKGRKTTKAGTGKMLHILKCSGCQKYTLEKICPVCSTETFLPRPPKFSLDDKYAGLRREAKKKELAEKELY